MIEEGDGDCGKDHGNAGGMRMKNVLWVQEGRYLYFRNITFIAMRNLDWRGASFSQYVTNLIFLMKPVSPVLACVLFPFPFDS